MSTKPERGEPKLNYYGLKQEMAKRITVTVLDWLERPIEERPKFALLVMACAREYGVDRKAVHKTFENCFPLHYVNSNDVITEREV